MLWVRNSGPGYLGLRVTGGCSKVSIRLQSREGLTGAGRSICKAAYMLGKSVLTVGRRSQFLPMWISP